MSYPRLRLGIILLAFAGISQLLANQIAPVPPGASARVAVAQVRVAPDHRDWTYGLGENVCFKVTVTADNEPLENVVVSYVVGQEMMPAKKNRASAS